MWKFIPIDLWKTEIIPRLNAVSLQVLSCTCTVFRQLCMNKELWQDLLKAQLRNQLCKHPSLSEYLCPETFNKWILSEDPVETPRYLILSWLTQRCIACRKHCSECNFDNFIPAFVCVDCRFHDPRFKLITASNAVKEFKIPTFCLSQIRSTTCRTPYRTVGRLFRKTQVRALAIEYHKGEENWQLALQKSRDRSRKIKETLERQKRQRRQELCKAMKQKGLKFRDNTYGFSDYIGTGTADLEDLVQKTWKFKVVNHKLKFPLLWDMYWERRQRKGKQHPIEKYNFGEIEACKEILWQKYLEKMHRLNENTNEE